MRGAATEAATRPRRARKPVRATAQGAGVAAGAVPPGSQRGVILQGARPFLAGPSPPNPRPCAAFSLPSIHWLAPLPLLPSGSFAPRDPEPGTPPSDPTAAAYGDRGNCIESGQVRACHDELFRLISQRAGRGRGRIHHTALLMRCAAATSWNIICGKALKLQGVLYGWIYLLYNLSRNH